MAERLGWLRLSEQMTKAVEVITSVQRRRRWSRAEKDGSLQPRWRLSQSLPKWREQLGCTAASCFIGGKSYAIGRQGQLRSIRSL